MTEFTASVLIPAFNEEAKIAETVRASQKIPGVTQIIVIDDGSTDQTGHEAEKAGATVIRSQKNRGKGGALNLGLTAASGEYLLLLDADLGATAQEGRKLLAMVTQGKADLAIGRFPAGSKKSGFGFVLYFARKVIRRFTGLTLSAPLSGQRALNQKALKALGGKFAEGFGVEVAMIIDLARQGLVIKEVPVAMAHRKTRRNLAGFLHRGRQFLHICLAVGRRLLQY
ncbi:MAG TPA: glycosyltransferase family 2 protein [Firmicutes bacterium]|uniref:Glucosyl-3-phosphoglycerate synthase n=1 Tax=Capillibacterium thermochitinicola TaxID=2699427 RepID=A0A8J6I3H5_9FIRM|nr:glycosyltransferase family 2 protein [Capillibacterium thermochitinicola]HHW13209.1 glycosyltransferase family 2 protein [Bacillota bacterium]